MGPDMGDAHYPDPVVIDCDDCAVRGPGCKDCVISVLLRPVRSDPFGVAERGEARQAHGCRVPT